MSKGKEGKEGKEGKVYSLVAGKCANFGSEFSLVREFFIAAGL